MRLLIVEDDLVQRRFLQALLYKAGHEVLATANGLEAWNALEKEHLRLVITDWLMPGMDGQELINRIRTAEWPNYTYIILLTSRDTKDQKLIGLQSGADDYLTKPCDREELLARLTIGERILNLEARLSASLARLEQLASLDSLTGLFNRRAFYDNAQAELSRASRNGSSVSLIMLDVDHFKNINDRFGHPAGDAALCLLAKLFKQDRRIYDQVGRWGGEEFVVLLPQTNLAEASAVAERIRYCIAANPLLLPDEIPLQVRVSLGVSSTSNIPLDTPSMLEILLQQADKALYAAKAAGRNKVMTYEAASGKVS